MIRAGRPARQVLPQPESIAVRNPALKTVLCLLFLIGSCSIAYAQFGDEKPQGKGSQLGDQVTQEWQVGVKVEATTGPVKGLYITIPIATDWPEQEVRVLEEDYTTNVGKVNTRILEAGVKQLVVTIPQVRAGDEGHAIVTLEVLTNKISPPKDTSIFVVPKRLQRATRKFLGTSPLIDGRHKIVRDKSRELTKDIEPAWGKVDAIYKWTRENMAQGDGELKGTVRSIKDGEAIAEDIVGVFVALCRASKIPSRIVWVDGHFYAEFYLQDEEGEGYWFPAELIGAGELGEIRNPKPILQKGDNIKVPEMDKPQRFVPELVKGKKGGGRPRVTFIRELISAK